MTTKFYGDTTDKVIKIWKPNKAELIPPIHPSASKEQCSRCNIEREDLEPLEEKHGVMEDWILLIKDSTTAGECKQHFERGMNIDYTVEDKKKLIAAYIKYASKLAAREHWGDDNPFRTWGNINKRDALKVVPDEEWFVRMKK